MPERPLKLATTNQIIAIIRSRSSTKSLGADQIINLALKHPFRSGGATISKSEKYLLLLWNCHPLSLLSNLSNIVQAIIPARRG